jgi:hypothetical protein
MWAFPCVHPWQRFGDGRELERIQNLLIHSIILYSREGPASRRRFLVTLEASGDLMSGFVLAHLGRITLGRPPAEALPNWPPVFPGNETLLANSENAEKIVVACGCHVAGERQ